MWIGFDPGAKGAMAIIYEDGSFDLYDFEQYGINGYVTILQDLKPSMAGSEWVSARPKQGVTSTFNFGQRFGELQGMLAALEIGFTMVRPRVWQAACAIKPKVGKKGIQTAMLKLYPKAELAGPKGGIKDGRCDALGVAHYLRKTF